MEAALLASAETLMDADVGDSAIAVVDRGPVLSVVPDGAVVAQVDGELLAGISGVCSVAGVHLQSVARGNGYCWKHPFPT